MNAACKPLLITSLMTIFLLTACDDGNDTPVQETTTSRPELAELKVKDDPALGHSDEPAESTQHGEESGHSEETGEQHSAGAEEAPSTIHLTDTQRARLDLKVSEAKGGAATQLIQAPATIRFDADNVARVGPRLSARVLWVTSDLGDQVSVGDVVAELVSVELGKAKARYIVARAQRDAALAEFRRDQTLVEDQITSEAELQESRAKYLAADAEFNAADAELQAYDLSEEQIANIGQTDQPLAQYSLTAPVAGTIQQRDLVPGQSLSDEQTPIHIVNTQTMWAMLEAFEQDIQRLQPGQPVSLTMRALPGQQFDGTIDWISRELDPQTRTVRVRAEVANPDGLLRAGMFGNAAISTDVDAQYALVPVDAVQTVAGQSVVFVPGEEENEFMARPVTTGAEAGGQVEVREGLDPGDRLVVSGAFDLNSAMTAGSRSADHGH